MKLNDITDNYGARLKFKRVGRGIGSGKGKTAGRGYKGQKSRTGVSINGFEGGQMPLHRRLPKRGFASLNRIEYQVINLCDVQGKINSNQIDVNKPIDREILCNCGLIRSAANLVKLLSVGDINAKLHLIVDKASQAAITKIEAQGGKVEVK